MQILGTNGLAHKARFVGVFAGISILAASPTAFAQTAPATGTGTDKAPSEAARRAALSPYRFILQNAAPRKAAPVAEPKKPAAPPPVQEAAVQPRATQKPTRAPEPAPAPVESAPAPAPAPAVTVPAPEAAVASVSRKPPEPPPPRREIIPISTDEPRLSPALLREEPHGTVKVSFEIEPSGSVGEVKVLSSTNRSLNKATVEAVHGWKFQPVDEVLTVETEVVYNMDR